MGFYWGLNEAIQWFQWIANGFTDSEINSWSIQIEAYKLKKTNWSVFVKQAIFF